MAQTLPNGVVIPEQTESISSAGVQELRTVGQTADASLAGKASTGYVDNGLNDAKKFASQKYDESISYASAVESASLVRDADLEALIAGMEGMSYVGAWDSGTTYRINDVVTHGGDSWARLTTGATGEPGASATDWGLVARKGDGGGFGSLNETEVVGLYDTVDGGVEARLAAMEYDSGVRDMRAYLSNDATADLFTVQRVGRTVTISVVGLTAPGSSSVVVLSAGSFVGGFRPNSDRQQPLGGINYTVARLRVLSSGTVSLFRGAGGTSYSGILTYLVPPELPATLPGDPA